MEESKKLIEAYIKSRGYTWTYEAIMEELESYKKGYYISHTAKDVLINCNLITSPKQ